jgi:hypothetical protein
MKQFVITMITVIVLISFMFILSGCKLEIEATDNTVSASVDGDTTEKVDNIIDWIKERLSRLFDTDKEEQQNV